MLKGLLLLYLKRMQNFCKISLVIDNEAPILFKHLIWQAELRQTFLPVEVFLRFLLYQYFGHFFEEGFTKEAMK